MKKVVLLSAVLVTLFSCKKEASLNFKYVDQPQAVTCQNVNAQLLNEAYYVFENAINIQAENTRANPNANISTDRNLRGFVTRSRGVLDINPYITEDAVKVFNALKAKGLWENGKLISKSEALDCINNSISNNDLKRSFSALRSVEDTMDSKLLIMAITNVPGSAQYKDKALMTYAALDLYYGKFIGKDFTNFTYLVETSKAENPEVTIKQPEVKDPHAGHKHGPNDGHNH